ncbi:hypothetical protein [Streptomyces sp. NPDC094144]|uniref:hypothetical protein n=1 Tax=Streptomyces sp. NPDC094144 TaxID=3366056 RepID=UPI0037F2E616
MYAFAFPLTSGVSVPLDDVLARADHPARIAGPATVRDRFEDAWAAPDRRAGAPVHRGTGPPAAGPAP